MLATLMGGRARAALPLALVVLVLSATLGAAGVLPAEVAPLAAEEERFLVALAPGSDAAAVADAHDAQLLAHHARLDIAVLSSASSDLATALARDARVESSDAAGTVAGAGVRWDGVRWDGVRWDGVRWDGVRWDGVRWDGVRWDGSTGNETLDAALWGFEAMGVPAAWASGIPRTDRLVCVVDSGMDAAHPMLARNVWTGPHGTAGWDFVENDAEPQDEGGHGTHVAGLVAAVAQPRLAAARVLDATGHGTTENAIAGIAWCVDIGAHVILLALTEDAPTHAFRKAVAGAQRAGTLVVAAAGNNAPCADCVSYPAAYPRVLAVGAIGPDGAVAPFSATGRDVSALAPGVHVLSTYPGGGYAVGSGTSQAAAFAAGAAAFLWGAAPHWPAEHVAAHLQRTADPYGAPGRDTDSGAGMLDLARAVDALPGGADR